MSDQKIPNEQAIIEEILQRRHLKRTPIPGERMAVFKEKLGAEIQRSGKLSQEFVNALLHRLKNGEL